MVQGLTYTSPDHLKRLVRDHSDQCWGHNSVLQEQHKHAHYIDCWQCLQPENSSKCLRRLKNVELLTFEWFSNKIDPLPDLGSGGGEWLGVVGRRLDSMGSEWTGTGTHPQSVVTLPRTKTQQWTATWSARFKVSGPSHWVCHALY